MGRTPPIPGDLFAGVFRRYERAKERAGRIDFEDMLVRMLEGFETREDVAEEFRGQYRWFSVDEYQDTNPLQQALLEAWLGERRDLAVVGDEDQTIYTFTGATSEYLTGFSRRFPEARVVRLEDNYRSSPEILALANRLLAATPGRGLGAGKRLVATRPPGPEPTVVAFENAEREAKALVAEVGRLAPGRGRRRRRRVAVLVRTNAQIPPLEEALAAAGIRYQVRGELFFRRTEVLRAVGVLARARPGRPAGAWSTPWRRSGSSGSGSAATRSPTARRPASATPAWSPSSASPSGSRTTPASPGSWRRSGGGRRRRPTGPGVG